MLCASVACAEMAENIQKDQASYNKNGLHVVIALIGNWSAALNEWKNPSVADTPKIITQTEFHKKETVIPFLMYSTDGLDDKGRANITYNMKVTKPDGSLYLDQKGLAVIKGEPPHGIGMFQEPTGLQIEENDPLGEYEMIVSVTDHNKSITVDFPFKFDVIQSSASGNGFAAGEIPEPESWKFPDIVESARKVSPRNVEGKLFNTFGLVYSRDELKNISLNTMPPEELQKYADIVTHAYPDAVYRQFPASCEELPVKKLNATSVAGIAYVSLNAIDPYTREKAATCLKVIQRLLTEQNIQQPH